jgi:transposase-like protein
MKQTEKSYPREQRAFAILAKRDQIRKIDDSTYSVQSQSGNDQYIVKRMGLGWKCNCPDFVYRKMKCKHLHAVRYLLKIEKKPTNKKHENKPRTKKVCQYCNSANIVKCGYRYNENKKVQRYQCNECKRRFILNKGFEKMRINPKIITLSLDLYFKGVSLRKIVDHIKQFHGIEVSHMAVYKWIHKYVKLIKQNVDKLTPNISEVWHTDEMAVNVKGGWKWLWNVIDHNTRFLLASHVSDRRGVKDARKLFVRAKQTAKKRPSFVVTDGFLPYRDAVKKEFFTQKRETEHIGLANIHGFVNNNIVERLHGTIRERNKVMRGLGNNGSSGEIVEGFKIYYNFIRPHMGLNNRTPAEVADLPLQMGDNKWLSLIRMSI